MFKLYYVLHEMKSQQYSIYHINKMTSFYDMCTRTIDVNFGATILTLTLGDWSLELDAGNICYIIYYIC